MVSRKVLLRLAILLAILNFAGIILEKPSRAESITHDVIKPTMEFIGYSVKKLWEGTIDGKQVVCFQAEKVNKVVDVIVVIEDNLPTFYKRVEYYDEDANKNLDFVKMKVYEEGKGWRDVGITGENKYGLGYANTKYNKILGKINEKQAKETEKQK